MAKANIEVDTETGEISVSINGKPIDNVENVESVHARKSQMFDYESNQMKPYSSFEVCIYEKDEAGVSQYTRMMAKDNDFVKTNLGSKIQDEISNLMRK